jgi:hypothetical protein
MKRILLAAGSLATVLVVAVGAVSVVGETGSPQDESRPFDREALDEQARTQAAQVQAARDELSRKVAEYAQQLAQGN